MFGAITHTTFLIPFIVLRLLFSMPLTSWPPTEEAKNKEEIIIKHKD
jgi:hypothetical protein